jgi:folate-binding protein YgfZ
MSATTLSDRALIRLSGDDVRGFLQGLVTNDVSGELPVWAGLLSAQGKSLFDFLIWADGADILIDCEASQADALARRLTLYRLRRTIAIARDETLAVHWAREGSEGVPDPRLLALGRRWIAPPGEPAEGWLAHRLHLGVTEGIAELGADKSLWLETNAVELNGVSFSKGCYVGQENTARMNWRQKVNRRLIVIRRADDPGDIANAWYSDLGLAIVRRRIEDIATDPAAILPDWLRGALTAA